MISADGVKNLFWGSAVCAALPFFLCLLAGCGDPSPEAAAFSGNIMGTQYHVTVVALEAQGRAEEIHAAVRKALAEVDLAMSTYKPDSELSRFNVFQEATPFPLSPALREVFDCALAVSRATDGAFDVTVGPLVNAWGFGPDKAPLYPEEAALAALRARVGYTGLVLTEAGISKSNPACYCDLSALAKGYAVDQAAAALEALGVHRYLVEVGGETRCKGKNGRGLIWTIGIEKPIEGERSVQRVLSLRDSAIATSGDYRNFKTIAGRRLSHAIDPRTGAPVTHPPASVSVLHASCMWADAYATGLMVLGVEAGKVLAEQEGLAALFIVRDEAGGFSEVMSSAFVEVACEGGVVD